MARINLELGGKDPFIVCADVAAEIEVAARGGAWAAFLNAGQVCTSAERFYVEHAVYDDFVSAFVEHTRTLRVGDPLDDRHRHRPDGLRGPAREGRARSSRRRSATAPRSSFGGDHAGHERGYFFAPDRRHRRRRPSTALLREETFGPVAPIVPVRSLDEAIELANGDALRARRQRLHARPRRTASAACAS